MYSFEVKGLGCISAKIVADSISEHGVRITTYELEYPRFIHSELMTHRMFSRNAASSRAIPVSKMLEQVRTSPAHPIHWGQNQSGMQAKEELNEDAKNIVIEEWSKAAYSATQHATRMDYYGAHKQIVNRLLEPFQVMKTVVTATEWNNFWALRDHKDAQPEIAELAKCMHEAYEYNKPIQLRQGDWHTPYYSKGFWMDSGYGRLNPDTSEIEPVDSKRPGGKTKEEAIKISASCCAQVSFRKNDQSLEKAEVIYDRLVESKPVHASPFEHVATPMNTGYAKACKDGVFVDYGDGPEGVTHTDLGGNLWSGNLKGWVQHRQLIKNNVVKG